MKRFGFIVLGCFVTGGVVLGLAAARYQPTLPPNVTVGGVKVGGLMPEEALKRVKGWWGARQMDLLNLTHPDLDQQPGAMTPQQAGLVLDAESSIAQIRLDTFQASVGRAVGLQEKQEQNYDFVWKTDTEKLEKLKAFVAKQQKPKKPAQAFYRDGKIVLVKEAAGIGLKVDAMQERLVEATMGDGKVLLPMAEGEKKVPDSELQKISEVMISFTTKFPAYKTSRNNNIQLASSKIEGKILMPGEIFSFNDTVGRRTIAAGFKEAGVFANGRHDTGIGGGICQVSTTLYNACLLANMKIIQRQNHSMPVPYVPVGRDATVDFGSIDYQFQNSYDVPIAIGRKYVNGALTFYLLGKKDPSLKVEIVSGGVSYFGTKVRTVRDSSLAAGRQVVEERGSAGRSVNSWRLIYKNGALVKKESLGTSHYPGGIRIVRVGTGARPKAAAPAGQDTPPANQPSEPTAQPDASE